MQQKFNLLKAEYENFYRKLWSEGKLPMKDTLKGTWGVAHTDDILEIFQKLNLGKYKNFLDLGSGDGKVVNIAALFTKATGIEIDKDLIKKSNEIRKKYKLINARFLEGDYHHFDISGYDIIFVNPDAPFYRGLEDKLIKQLKGQMRTNILLKSLQIL